MSRSIVSILVFLDFNCIHLPILVRWLADFNPCFLGFQHNLSDEFYSHCDDFNPCFLGFQREHSECSSACIGALFQSLFSWILTRKVREGVSAEEIISILVFLDFNLPLSKSKTGIQEVQEISILVFLDFNSPFFSVLFLIIVYILPFYKSFHLELIIFPPII